jgi:predicted DsbA family dithiol-disulfide isomerase
MDVVTRHHPYLLYPNVSADGLDLRASLAHRYRQSPEQLFTPVEAAGREAGIPLDFSKVARVYSTVDAHTLARHAQYKGTASAFAEGIFTAYFLEGRNLADRRVLVDTAVRHGFTNAETHALLDDDGERRRTREDAERTIKAGVRGVPLYVVNGQETVSGAQVPSVFRGAIARALAAVA